MVIMKQRMELVKYVQMDALNVHPLLIVLHVLLNQLPIVTELVNAQMELSSVLLRMVSDIANNVFNIVKDVQTDLLVQLVKLHLFFQLITHVSVQRITILTQEESVFHVKLVVKHV